LWISLEKKRVLDFLFLLSRADPPVCGELLILGKSAIRHTQVHPSTIYRMLKKNQLPAFRVGSDWRFSVEAIDKWRAAVESGAPVPPSDSH
jgi:excisionase family DNA binding protein